MECLIQYLDDLEDFVYSLALAAERIRRAIRALMVLFVSISLSALTVLLALAQPPLGLAIVSLLCVTLLYRAVVNHSDRTSISS